MASGVTRTIRPSLIALSWRVAIRRRTVFTESFRAAAACATVSSGSSGLGFDIAQLLVDAARAVVRATDLILPQGRRVIFLRGRDNTANRVLCGDFMRFDPPLQFGHQDKAALAYLAAL